MNEALAHNLSRILIVDDNPKNLHVLGNFLKKEGFSIEFALNGPTALKWIGQKYFDLVLLDIMMPGMDGYEVCKILKSDKSTHEIPVVFLTAKTDTESIVMAFDIGAVDYVSKPFNFKELLARVSTQIEIKKGRDEKKRYLDEIEDKNELITSSINYAKTIQTAVMKSSHNLSECFSDQFSLALPKDIVSGDFFWSGKANGKILLGVFDCTGHGVPGAFMSLLSVTFLNDVIHRENIHEPHLILNRLREKVIASLEQKGFLHEVHAGMDAVIISYDPENMVIHFSGAFNRMYLIRDKKLQEYKGDWMPVSYFDKMNGFSLQEIEVKKADVLYLFTDGYTDQFGGLSNKKIGYSQFKELLLTHHRKSMEVQKQIFLDTYLNWKGNVDQVDDITVIGIRF